MRKKVGKWLLLSEAEEFLGISRSTIENRIKNEQIPSHILYGRRFVWVFLEDPIIQELREIRRELTYLRSAVSGAPPKQRMSRPTVRQERALPTRRNPTSDEWRSNLNERISQVGIPALAKTLNVTPTSIYRWRGNTRAPSPEVIARLEEMGSTVTGEGRSTPLE